MIDSRLSLRTLTVAAACTTVLAASLSAFPSAWSTVGLVLSSIQGIASSDGEPARERENLSPTAAFTPGNLVIYRVGSGAGALSASAAPVFLDEYTPAGTLVQSIAMPTAASGGNRILTASGSVQQEGLLTRSVDGKYLVFAGFDASIGTGSVATSVPSIVNRVIATVGADGIANTSTALTDIGGSPRSVASVDGNAFWISTSVTADGVRYALPAGGSSVQVSTTSTNLRGLAIEGGQLYSSSSSSSYRLGTVGSGLPTTSGQTITNLPGFPTSGPLPHAFVLLDMSPAVSGVDTLYVTDENADRIQKYSLVSGSWTARGDAVATDPRGLTAIVSGSTVTLFATTGGTSGGGSLYRITDSTGYNGTLAGTVATIASAATNTAFRGIALAPVQPAAPSIQVSPGLLDFQNQTVNTPSGSLSVTVTNTGTANLVLETPSFLSGDQGFAFVTDPNGTVIEPTMSAQIAFTFSPNSAGAKSDTVQINSNASGPAPSISLTGTGVTSPEIAVAPAAMSFGTQAVATTSGTRSVTISNTGTADLNIGQLVKGGANAGEFTITADPSNTMIAAGGTAKVTVTFSPGGEPGPRSATITIPSNDADEPDTIIALSGTAAAATTPDPVKSMWVWSGSPNPVTDPTGRADLIQRATAAGITDLYVSVYSPTPNSQLRQMFESSDVAALNAAAHTAGMKVWAAYGDPAWQNQTCADGQSSYERMEEVVAFNSERSAAERFDGVMLDVEPGAGFNLTNYANMHNCFRGVLPADIKLGTAISAFWHTPDRTPVEYPVGGEAKDPAQHIIDLPLDQIVVMGYRDNAGATGGNGIIGLDEFEINYASSIGKAGLILAGLETKDLGVPAEEHVTFFEEGSTVLVSESALVASHFVSSTGFGGFSIHAYGDEYLSGVGNWPFGTVPEIDVSPDVLNFPLQVVNLTSSALSVTVTNNGPDDLILQSPVFTTGTQFAVVAFPPDLVLGPTESTTIAFTFSPTSVGTKTDTVTFLSNDPGPAPTVTLTGQGVLPTANFSVDPTSVNLGNVIVGGPGGNSSVMITNNGLGSVEITALPITGTNADEFSANAVGGVPATLPSGGSLTVNLTFNPSAPGSRTATLGITSDPGSALTVPLSGSAQANTPPVAVDDSATTPQNQDLMLDASDLVANDIDPDLQTLTVIAASNVTNGFALLSAGTITFSPTPGFTGTAGFDYSVSDGIASDIGHVTITVTSNEPRTLIVDTLEDDPAADECLDGVPNDCSLRRAIGTANDGDTITFDPSIYTQPGLAPEGTQLGIIELGGSDIDIDTSITINGPGAAQLTISGGDASRVLSITPNNEVVITGVTIANGFVNGSFPANAGAGIYNDEATLTLNNVVVRDSTATGDGGGIYNDSGTVVLNATTVSLNTSNSGSGGGIASRASSLGPTLTVIDSTIANNLAQFGDGGGIFSWSDAAQRPATLNVTNSSVSGNIGASGGGISSDPGPDGVTTLNISNSTIAFNSAAGLFASGGGVWNGFGSATASINSTIISDNILMGSGRDLFSGSPLDGSYNLVENSFGFTFASGSNNIFGVSPLLGPLQDNGGPTLTHAFNLSLGLSPAIDQGSAFGLITDQRGAPRPTDLPGYTNASGGDGSDIGAFEMLAPTAAPASISGRVTTSNGRGISSVVVSAQGMDGVSRSVVTNTFGYYRLDGLTAGESFVVTVSARRYEFATPSLLINLQNDLAGIDFIAGR